MFGNPEVANEYSIAFEKYVTRLDVSMDDILSMGSVEPGQNITRELNRFVWREGSAFQSLLQRLSFDVVHDVIENVAGLSGVIYGNDVRMLETGQDSGFVQKATSGNFGCLLRLDDLYGDSPVKEGVACEEHRTHPAAGELALYLVLRC